MDKALVLCDNQGALQLSGNPMFHERTKHINVRLHFIRDVISAKEVEVKHVSTDQNASDMLTKVVSSVKFDLCLSLLGIGE